METLPHLLSAGGAVTSGNDAYSAARTNAQATLSQGFADEQAQRRAARQFMGTQAAAIAQSGASGPSTDMLTKQSSVEAELDALNIRYGALTRATGLLAQGRAAKRESRYLAGGQLLKAYAANKLAKGNRGPDILDATQAVNYRGPLGGGGLA